MKKKAALILLGAVMLTAIVGVAAFRYPVARLESFEESVVKSHSENGMLSDLSERDAVLDEVEAFIAENKASLLIQSYERTSAAILVTFLSGFNHSFQPYVEGFK